MSLEIIFLDFYLKNTFLEQTHVYFQEKEYFCCGYIVFLAVHNEIMFLINLVICF